MTHLTFEISKLESQINSDRNRLSQITNQVNKQGGSFRGVSQNELNVITTRQPDLEAKLAKLKAEQEAENATIQNTDIGISEKDLTVTMQAKPTFDLKKAALLLGGAYLLLG